MPQKNLALELLRKLINDEIKLRTRNNWCSRVCFGRCWIKPFARIKTGRSESAQVIEQMIRLAKDMNAAKKRGEDLKLSEDEVAFYDALEVNDTAVKVLGDDTLRNIARELVEDRTQEYDDRLDGEGKRASEAAVARQAIAAQVRLSTGQAGAGDADGVGAGGVALQGSGGIARLILTFTLDNERI